MEKCKYNPALPMNAQEAMGKKINQIIDVINAGFPQGFTIKGSVSILPTSANEGDVYTVGGRLMVWTNGKWVDLGSCSYDPALNVRNLLDNSDFRNPINQRGLTQYTGKCYTIDRWYTYSSAADIVVNDGYVSVVGSALLQKIDIDPDKTYTAAIKLLDGSVIVRSGTFTAGFGSTSIGVNCSVREGVPAFLISSDQGKNGVLWAALYEGAYTADTLPAYQYKGYAAELAECQRYYLKAAAQPVSGWAYDWGRVTVLLPTPVAMRTAAPTVTIVSGGATFRLNGNAQNCTLSSGSAAVNGVLLYFTHTAGTYGAAIFPELALELSCDL